MAPALDTAHGQCLGQRWRSRKERGPRAAATKGDPLTWRVRRPLAWGPGASKAPHDDVWVRASCVGDVRLPRPRPSRRNGPISEKRCEEHLSGPASRRLGAERGADGDVRNRSRELHRLTERRTNLGARRPRPTDDAPGHPGVDGPSGPMVGVAYHGSDLDRSRGCRHLGVWMEHRHRGHEGSVARRAQRQRNRLD